MLPYHHSSLYYHLLLSLSFSQQQIYSCHHCLSSITSSHTVTFPLLLSLLSFQLDDCPSHYSLTPFIQLNWKF
uniref:Uncharacterized protein n=1 Tax=Octopus bimaculoides TaxID=37653 RepID=A0A0L8I5U3_OCTBM